MEKIITIVCLFIIFFIVYWIGYKIGKEKHYLYKDGYINVFYDEDEKNPYIFLEIENINSLNNDKILLKVRKTHNKQDLL